MVSTVATVNLPDGVFLSCFKESKMLSQHRTELLKIGIFAVQAGILERISWEGMEKKKRFLGGSTVSWWFCLYQQVRPSTKRHNPVDFLIWMDVTVTDRAIIRLLLPSKERGSLAPVMSIVLSWKSFSQLQKNSLQFCSHSRQEPLVLREGKEV